MEIPSFQQAVGFSVGDTLSLFLLRTLLDQSNYSRALYEQFNSEFPGRSVSYEYVARMANTLENNGFLLSQTEGRKSSFKLPRKGKSDFRNTIQFMRIDLAKFRLSSIDSIIFLRRMAFHHKITLSRYTKIFDRLYRSCYLSKMSFDLWHSDSAYTATLSIWLRCKAN